MNNILRITSIMLLLALSAYGQGVKTTTPVGLAVADVPAGNTALSIPFLKADLYQGAVVSLAENPEEISTTIILTEADWSAGRFDEGDFPKFYAEIQETSQYSGLGLDIIESGPNWIKVYGLFSDFGISAGDKLVIRTHYIIDDLFAFLGNDRKIEQRGSVIKLFYPDGQSGAAVWTGTDWASTDGTSTTGETPIYPGQGFILSSDLPLKLVHTGNVRTTPLLIPVYAVPSLNLVGSTHPVSKPVGEMELESFMTPYADGVKTHSASTLATVRAYISDGNALISDSGDDNSKDLFPSLEASSIQTNQAGYYRLPSFYQGP